MLLYSLFSLNSSLGKFSRTTSLYAFFTAARTTCLATIRAKFLAYKRLQSLIRRNLLYPRLLIPISNLLWSKIGLSFCRSDTLHISSLTVNRPMVFLISLLLPLSLHPLKTQFYLQISLHILKTTWVSKSLCISHTRLTIWALSMTPYKVQKIVKYTLFFD